MKEFLLKTTKPLLFIVGFLSGFLVATILLGLRFTGML